MADDPQAPSEAPQRDTSGRFSPGSSGNPRGRPVGTVGQATLLHPQPATHPGAIPPEAPVNSSYISRAPVSGGATEPRRESTDDAPPHRPDHPPPTAPPVRLRRRGRRHRLRHGS